MQCWNWGQDLRTSSRPKQDTCGRCGSVSFKVKSTSKPGGRKQKKTLTTWQPGASSRNHSKRLGKGMFDQSQSLPKPCLRHFSICQPDSWLEYLSYLCTKSLTSLTIPRSRNGPLGKHRSTSMWYVVGAIWVQRQRLTTIWKKEGFVSANAAPMPNIPDRYILLFFRFYMYTSTFYRTIEYAICIYIYYMLF